MKWNLKGLSLAASLISAVLLAGCGSTGSDSQPSGTQPSSGSEETYVMRVATPTNNDPQTNEMNLFKKTLEEKSKGKIKVELYPASQLGSNDQMLQQLSSGSIQGLLEPTAFLGGFDELITVVDIPYIWPDVSKATEYLNGKGKDLFEPSLNGKGITALQYYEYGPRIILLKDRIDQMSDFSDKKIRVMGAPVLIDEINAWGGSGVAMGVPELFTALQQGTIDGLESAAMFFYSGKYYENSKYLFLEPKGAEVTIFMANSQWLKSLPEDLQKAVRDSAAEITEEAHKYARENNDKAIEEMKKLGVEVIESKPELHAQLVEASKTIQENFEKRVPEAKAIVEQIKADFKTN